jgi:oligopeptidase A
MNDNPLLDFSGLPRFASIRAEHATPAVDRLLADARATIERVVADPREPSWTTVAEPVADALDRLQRAWGALRHLNAVVSTPALRDAYNGNLPRITAFYTEIGQDERLYAKYRALAASSEFARLDDARRRVIENELRDFRLTGAELPPAEKARFRDVMERLATTQAKFDENVLDATHAWSRRIVDEVELEGLPANVVHRAREAATAAGHDGWLLTLDAPTYVAVLTHAASEPLRRDFYEAWVTRASELGPHAGLWDNGPLMEEILALRHEVARLAGFANFAEFSLATKMARDPAEVIAFLERLARLSRPAAQREFAELEQFAGRKLAAWDVAFWSERLKHARLEVSEEALRPYFPLPRVLAGLFTVVHRLYGVRVVANPAVAAYHPDVRYFDVLDHDGTVRAGFYLDLYARPKKRGGAWMDECVGRIRLGDQSALPVAYLVCNFSPPAGGQPSLLTHHEVLTLFHEFGHGLHHMLTRVECPSVAGINGVPWDAVELPSQFMENFAWREEVLPLISAHAETGEPLPHDMLTRLQASRTFQAGMQTVRQLEFALFDFRLHTEYVPGHAARIAGTLAEVREAVAVVRPPEFNRFQNSFTHVFSGGYAAGYYSYKWAEVLAADAFGAFEEHGVFHAATAHRFLDAILERGGSRDAMEAFVEFRGREPEIEPLLRQMGLAA